ncbi:hypothetical protein CPHO_08965 [Corynebacterium phocae]|uniref:ABC transmembrane type-1 domain-containing protein n=1 Tax=Corynebacterium phocae TaxID=161895 RepID=A0A1L7D4K6_9CORY|nr:hypothetical protein CPHO_08965 [Corynebacterium phocae]
MVEWVLGITRPVLVPLAWSTALRILNQVLGIVLFVVPAYAILSGKWALVPVLAVMVLTAVVKAFLRYLEHFCGHLVAFKSLELIRIRVFRDIFPQAPAISARTGEKAVGTGDMLTRLTRDIGQIETFFAHTTAPVISAVVVPLGVLVCAAAGTPVPSRPLPANCLVLSGDLAPCHRNGLTKSTATPVLTGRELIGHLEHGGGHHSSRSNGAKVRKWYVPVVRLGVQGIRFIAIVQSAPSHGWEWAGSLSKPG